MIKIGADYSKLKKNLKLATCRLKLLQAKKSEQNEKLKSEIGNYLKKEKYVQAKIQARKIILEKKSVEAIELIKMYCDDLLEKYELFEQKKQPDFTLIRVISSLIWVAPHYQTLVPELEVIGKQLSVKYGPRFNKMALKNKEETVDPELIKRVIVPMPSDETTEKCLKNICLKYGITYKKSEECVKDNLEEVKKCGSEIQVVLNEEKEHFKVGSNDEVLTENASDKTDKISRKKSFKSIFKSKISKKSKQHSDETISGENEVKNDNVSASLGFQVQENQSTDQESSSTSEEINNKGTDCDFPLNNDNDEINGVINDASENHNGQHSFNDEKIRENSFIPTAPPSPIPVNQPMYYQPPPSPIAIDQPMYYQPPPLPIPVYQPTTQSIYDKPPPSYESLYSDDSITEADRDRNLAKWLDLIQLPACPSEDLSFNNSSENISDETEKKDKHEL